MNERLQQIDFYVQFASVVIRPPHSVHAQSKIQPFRSCAADALIESTQSMRGHATEPND